MSFSPLWDTIGTIGGVADGFAKDGDFVYASDTKGVFYRVDPLFGTAKDLKYGPDRGPMFANAAPAVDDQRVYFAIRNVGTAQPNLDHYPGRLVALNKETFTLEWEANLDAPANTNPLVWTQGPNVVLVGDTKGTIYAFDRKTGAPSPFALDAQCQPMSKLSLGAPSQAGKDYQTLTGVSEPILASGNTGQALLIMGVSGAEGGSLKAFRAGGGYNAAWTIPTIPEQTLTSNQPFTHTADLTLTAWNGAPLTDRTLGLAAYWVPTPEARATGAQARALPGAVPAEVTMKPGDTLPITITFTPIPEDGTEGNLAVVANPRQAAVTDTRVGQKLREAVSLTQGITGESNYRAGNWNSILGDLPGHCDGAAGEIHPDGVEAAMADNLLAGAMTIGQMVDLSVQWQSVPASVACDPDQSRQVSFTIHNPSTQALQKVPYEAYVTDGLGRFPLKQGRTDLAPGANTLTATFYTRSCGATSSLNATVNLGPEPRPVKEPTFDNNTATTAILIDEHAPNESAKDGNSTVFIVPADCQPNPDPASPYPCTNYPKLRKP